MKPTKQTVEKNNILEFEKHLSAEMKNIPELQNFTDRQIEEYCSILRCYSELIVNMVLHENSTNKPILRIIPTTFKQAA